jgi:hypothetical protein
MKTKYLLFINLVLIVIFNSCGGNSENNLKKIDTSAFEEGQSINNSENIDENSVSNDYSLFIKLTPFVPPYPDFGETGRQLLVTRINSAVSKIGLGGDGSNPRFIIGPSINLISKNITGTSPTKFANTYEITLMTCDVITETVYQTYTFTVKGVGDSPEKSFINAIRDFKLENNDFYQFLVSSQEKIISYYENNCDSFLKDAENHAKSRNYNAAFTILNNIPMEAKSCYALLNLKREEYFQMSLNTDCQGILASMKAEMGKSNDDSASGFNSAAMSYYAMIDPSSVCFKEAESIYQSYIKKINPQAKRDWDFKMQQYQDMIKKNDIDQQFSKDSIFANFDYLKHKDEMQAKAEAEGSNKLLQKYQYDQLPWIRKVFHLGKYDPFDGSDK